MHSALVLILQWSLLFKRRFLVLTHSVFWVHYIILLDLLKVGLFYNFLLRNALCFHPSHEGLIQTSSWNYTELDFVIPRLNSLHLLSFIVKLDANDLFHFTILDNTFQLILSPSAHPLWFYLFSQLYFLSFNFLLFRWLTRWFLDELHSLFNFYKLKSFHAVWLSDNFIFYVFQVNVVFWRFDRIADGFWQLYFRFRFAIHVFLINCLADSFHTPWFLLLIYFSIKLINLILHWKLEHDFIFIFRFLEEFFVSILTQILTFDFDLLRMKAIKSLEIIFAHYFLQILDYLKYKIIERIDLKPNYLPWH